MPVPPTMRFQRLAVWRDIPTVREELSFKDGDAAEKFYSAIRDGRIGLTQVEYDGRLPGTWHQFVSCGSADDPNLAENEKKKRREKPGPGQTWLREGEVNQNVED